MNEFFSENGSLVAVGRRYSRWDGYYWPIAECEVSDLRDKLIYFACNEDFVIKARTKSRELAHKKFDWDDVSAAVVECIEEVSVKHISTSLISEVRDYEASGLKRLNRIIIRYQKLFLLLRRLAYRFR